MEIESGAEGIEGTSRGHERQKCNCPNDRTTQTEWRKCHWSYEASTCSTFRMGPAARRQVEIISCHKKSHPYEALYNRGELIAAMPPQCIPARNDFLNYSRVWNVLEAKM